MNDTATWIRDVLILALGGLLSVLWRLVLKLYSSLKDEVNILRGDLNLAIANTITKDTWIRMDRDWRDELATLREERKELHRENTERLDRINATLVQVVELAVTVRSMGEEVKALRDVKHEHGDMIQSHEARLHFLEKQP